VKLTIRLLAFASVLSAVACTSSHETPATEAASDQTQADGRTLTAAVELGRAPTHRVQVGASGAFTFQPIHYPAPARRQAAAKPEMPVNRAPTPITGATFALETVAIARGENVAARGAIRTRDDGAVEIARGLAVETLEANGSGLEQSWKLATRPAGTGDLVIEVAVSGQSFTSDT
jgi:hypothetical protein